MKTLRKLAIAGLFVSAVGIAQAVTYSDTNWHGAYLTAGQEAKGTFDITADYDKSAYQIDSATVTFTFMDDLCDTIVVGFKKFLWWEVPVFGQENESGTITVNGVEIASEASNGLWFFSMFSYGLPGDLVFALSKTGVLEYSITSTSGDFCFNSATLCADGSPRQVPDTTATLALFGAALLGLVAVRRRIA